MENKNEENEEIAEFWGQPWEKLYPIRRGSEEYSIHVKQDFEYSNYEKDTEKESFSEYFTRA